MGNGTSQRFLSSNLGFDPLDCFGSTNYRMVPLFCWHGFWPHKQKMLFFVGGNMIEVTVIFSFFRAPLFTCMIPPMIQRCFATHHVPFDLQ